MIVPPPLPGVAYALAEEGRPVRAHYEGELGPDRRVAVGSISKSFTALVAARYVDRGRLRWDATVGSAFPEADPAYRGIAFEDLMRHRSSFPESAGTYPPGIRFDGTYAVGRARYAALLLKTKPAEGRVHYANAHFTLAAIWLEKLTGKSWPTLVEEEVTRPWGLRSVRFGTSEWSDGARGHTLVKGVWSPIRPGPNSGNHPLVFGADGVRATVTDLARYALRHAEENPRYLRPATWRRLHSALSGERYAMGLIAAPNGAVLHGGSNTVNYALFVANPKLKRGAAAMVNAYSADVPAMVDAGFGAWLQGGVGEPIRPPRRPGTAWP